MIDQSTFNFPTIVEGKNLTATVLAEEGEGLDFHYRVRFSDGYEDVFNEQEGKLVGLRGPGSQPYADAIKYDVKHYIGLDTDKFRYVFPEVVDGEKVNVWVFEEEEEDEEENMSTSYNVHVKKEYRFHLMKVGDSWMMSNRNEKKLSDSDRKLAQNVEDMLIALV